MNEKEKFQLAMESLNPTQRESVLSDADSLQILAGPGSGKTRVLTYRVAYLVIEKNIQPNNIIVVTFTNKAANEMKTRLAGLIGENRTHSLLIGTFHAICSRLLHQYASYAGLDSQFTICDPEQSKAIISKIQKDKTTNIDDFTRNTLTAGTILGIISKAKSKGENEHKYKELHGHEFKCKDIAVIFMAYEKELKIQNVVDYDNLLLKCCDLLRAKNDVLSKIKSILVDEYQDTNVVQYDLIKLMMDQKNKKTITIVGDPDQSIFSWRSAEPKNFGKMAEEFDGTSSIKMEQNYRSTKMVIESALHVIEQDASRIDKQLYTDNPEGIPISLITTNDAQSQADFVAAEIKKAIVYSKGLIQYKDIAILMRMNFISQQFESTFRLSQIPFTMVGGDRFFDRVEVKDMTSYLSFAFNPKNVTAFTRIINVPKRGIGEVWLNRILEHDMNSHGTMLDSLREIAHGASSPKFPAPMMTKIKDLVMICTHVREMIDEKKEVASILSYIYDATHYEKYLKDHYFQDHESRWQNLGELLSIAKNTTEVSIHSNTHYDEDPDNMSTVDWMDEEIKTVNNVKVENSIKTEYGVKAEPDANAEPDVKTEKGIKAEPTVKAEPNDFDFDGFDFEDFENDDFGPDSEEYPEYKADPVTEFLEYCALCSNQKELEEAEGGKVTIATIHSAKGLEWPCVFIATCNDGVIPHSRCDDVEEEGRLLYVAMTRSKFLLYCISLKQRDIWGQRKSQTPSHFLSGMKKDIYIKKPPEWNRVMRTMLATTINLPITEEDAGDELSLQKKRVSSSQPSSQSSASDIRFGVNGNRTDLAMMGGFSSASSLFSASQKASKSKKKGSSVKREVKEEPDNIRAKLQKML